MLGRTAVDLRSLVGSSFVFTIFVLEIFHTNEADIR